MIFKLSVGCYKLSNVTNSELIRKMPWYRTYDALYASEKNDGAITLNFNIYEIVSLSETLVTCATSVFQAE